MDKKIFQSKTTFSRQLRRNQTDAEKMLWAKLRNKQLAETKFRRQQQIGPYIVDFISFENKLIIELDGGQHSEESVITYDTKRTSWLKSEGYFVLRFWDNDILTKIDSVLEKILLTMKHPHPNLPPSRGKE